MKFKYLINEITINLYSFRNFLSIEDTRRMYNPKVDLSKFVFNKKILNKVIVIGNFVLFLFCDNGREKERENIVYVVWPCGLHPLDKCSKH